MRKGSTGDADVSVSALRLIQTAERSNTKREGENAADRMGY
jgi:hypothetical protein